MLQDIRSDPASAPVRRRVFSNGSPLVAALVSVTAHAAMVAALLSQETTAINIGEVIIVDLVISEEGAQTANPHAPKPLAPNATTAEETGADADKPSPPPIGENRTIAFPVPRSPTTAIPPLAPPPPAKTLEPVAADVPRMRDGPFALPPRRPQRISSAASEPPENVQVTEGPLHKANRIENANHEDNDSQPTKTPQAKGRASPAEPSAEPVPTPEPGAGNQAARDGLTDRAAVYGGRIKAAPLEGNPRPPYPARAIRRGWQGRVVLEVEIMSTGAVGEIKIVASSGYSILDRAALNTVRQWRFEPAKRTGTLVRARAQVPVLFELTR